MSTRIYISAKEYDILLQLAKRAGYKRVWPYLAYKAGLGPMKAARALWAETNERALNEGKDPIFFTPE